MWLEAFLHLNVPTMIMYMVCPLFWWQKRQVWVRFLWGLLGYWSLIGIVPPSLMGRLPSLLTLYRGAPCFHPYRVVNYWSLKQFFESVQLYDMWLEAFLRSSCRYIPILLDGVLLFFSISMKWMIKAFGQDSSLPHPHVKYLGYLMSRSLFWDLWHFLVGFIFSSCNNLYMWCMSFFTFGFFQCFIYHIQLACECSILFLNYLCQRGIFSYFFLSMLSLSFCIIFLNC